MYGAMNLNDCNLENISDMQNQKTQSLPCLARNSTVISSRPDCGLLPKIKNGGKIPSRSRDISSPNKKFHAESDHDVRCDKKTALKNPVYVMFAFEPECTVHTAGR